jgi:hypothetical protein
MQQNLTGKKLRKSKTQSHRKIKQSDAGEVVVTRCKGLDHTTGELVATS